MSINISHELINYPFPPTLFNVHQKSVHLYYLTASFILFSSGRCIHSIHVSLINSTCVSLSWSLLHIRPVPLFLVVQWFPKKEQDSKDFGLSKQTWARLPYTNPPVHLRGKPSTETGDNFWYLPVVFSTNLSISMFALKEFFLVRRSTTFTYIQSLLMEKENAFPHYVSSVSISGFATLTAWN